MLLRILHFSNNSRGIIFSVFSFCSLDNRELKDIKYRGLRKWAVWSLEYCRLFLIGINSIFSNCLFSAT